MSVGETLGDGEGHQREEPSLKAHCRAVAFPRFKVPRVRVFEAAGVAHEASIVRDRILLGKDDGSWLRPETLRKVRWEEESDNDDAPEDVDSQEEEKMDSDLFDTEDAAYEKYLTNLDPTEWKKQDHYKVLGISKLRYKASMEQIRTAYRKKVLRHHPDKRRHRGEKVADGEEDYFTCITRAHDTLSHKARRRAYDSVDPTFNEKIPTSVLKGEDRKDFFNVFEPVFRRNARWSTIQPVPKVGGPDDEIDVVNDFYSFWFEFTTWREFSYLDEEDKERGENRYERRWIEKENKAERDRRRKEEIRRIRTLVENAYNSDPRIARFKEDEKAKKEAEKQAKLDASRKKKEEERKMKEERERKEKEKREAEEAAAKQKRDEEKKEKERRKRAAQKERKTFQAFCKESNYFASPNDDVVTRMEQTNQMCTLLPLERLQQLNQDLTQANSDDRISIVNDYLEELDKKMEAERQKTAELASGGKKAEEENGEDAEWSEEEVQLLVKAASTLFPVGTKARWAVIAEFINEHKKEGNSSKPKTAKDVIAKARGLKNVESTAKEQPLSSSIVVNKKGGQVQAAPTERTDGPAATGAEVSWTADEQKRLEQALKSMPVSTPERWDRIADCIPGKTKKDCVKRYKELAELVRAKKAAQQKVSKG